MRHLVSAALPFGDTGKAGLMQRHTLDIVSFAPETSVRTGTVRVGGLMGFGELVAEMGGDPQRLVAACGLAPMTLAKPDNIIPFSVGARLLHLAQTELSSPHFGLLLGQRQNLALLGPIGFLMQHSPDVRSALAKLMRYMHLHVQGASARLAIKGDWAEFSYQILIPGIVGAEQVYAICMANEFRFLQLLCGRDWLPSAVHFCFRAPPNDAPFRQFFGAPVRFSQPASAVFFPVQDLDRKISSADPGLGEILDRYRVADRIPALGREFLGQLRSVVRTMLPTGNCTADRVAQVFAMHRRTLHRQLAANNTTFEEITDSMRQQIALQMLAQTDMKLGQLAEMLGYGEVSSFNRAFRRWAGMSPSEWRAAKP